MPTIPKTFDPQLKSQLIRLLKDRVEFALVFGSAARGELTHESDVDLAIYLSDCGAHPSDDQLNWAWSLRSQMERPLDVVILNTADPIIRAQAAANGVPIAVKDQAFLDRFNAQSLSQYLDFKKSREGVEKHLTDQSVLLLKKELQ